MSKKLAKDAKIAIIGAGIGGLATALAFKNAGFTNVCVYERDVSFDCRREGYGLTLTYNSSSKGPLQQLGILEELAREDTPSRSHYTFDKDGYILGYYGNAFRPWRGAGQRGNLRVPRQTVRRTMMNRFVDESNSCNIQWGKRLIKYVESTDDDSGVSLFFEDGTEILGVDLLIGADGVNSTVTKHFYSINNMNDPIEYTGIMIVLGITNYHHELLNERGFYTVDGEHRLFTMPFEGSVADDNIKQIINESSHDNETDRRTMWQLSFRLDNEEEAMCLGRSSPDVLLNEIRRRCSGWHEPINMMLTSTPLDTVWGTGLKHRIPCQELTKNHQSRVILVGDAKHAMTPFKGQGANQALTDGPLLVTKLLKSGLFAAISEFEREMVCRTKAKVLASRDAARFLHSQKILSRHHSEVEFTGLNKDNALLLIKELRIRNIGAHKANLDNEVMRVMNLLGLCSDDFDSNLKENISTSKVQQDALRFAENGNNDELRRLSTESSVHAKLISSAENVQGESCLHLAARNGHFHICKWLIYEVFANVLSIDKLGRTPLDVAISSSSKNDELLALLRSVSNYQSYSKTTNMSN